MSSPFIIETIEHECAPHIKPLDGSVCSSQDNLEIIKSELNIKENAPSKIIEEAKSVTDCDSESCIFVKLPSLDKSDLNERFLPKGPWNNKNWLSNIDIDSVLDQYEKKYSKFHHVEFQMIDFMKQSSSALRNFDWETFAIQKKYLGCVINTDVSSGRGEHWTAFFVDMDNRTVEHFDSSGQEAQQEFYDLIAQTADTLQKITGKKFTPIMVHDVKHQTKNTECGVYSLFYIIKRLEGVLVKEFQLNKNRIIDEKMEKFRKVLFRKN